VQWQALVVYHPLWEAQAAERAERFARTAEKGAVPASLSLPEVVIEVLQTPEAERRRERMAQTAVQRSKALTARLQQMEARRLQEELNLLDAEQRTMTVLARQQVLHLAEQERQEALRQHQQPQAEAEIRHRVVQQLARIRPDQRHLLNTYLQQLEQERENLSEQLQQRLARIEEDALRRLRERTDVIEEEFTQKRDELRAKSAARLQAEQLRASLQIRAFADGREPQTFPRITLQLPAAQVSSPSLPRTLQMDHRAVIEQEVKYWAEAICRKYGWNPVWQAQAGVPDVTARIAREMRGDMP
jgi:hypothetical protein